MSLPVLRSRPLWGLALALALTSNPGCNCGKPATGGNGGSGTGGSAGAGSSGGSATAGSTGGASAGSSNGGSTGAGCGLRSCASAKATCGPIGDGCGGVLECGSCTPPESCGGGGTPSVCGGKSGCVPKSCAGEGVACGPLADGCGNLLQCGSCTAPATCGGGGKTGVCGVGGLGDGGGGSCVPTTCAKLGYGCGPAGDGCGGLLDCGNCTAPQSCGAGGKPSVCGTPQTTCVPKSCASLGYDCGPAGDGCGNLLQCGSCDAGVCGGAGAGKCGGVSGCQKRSCAQAGATCGNVGDGCGGIMNCGGCTAPDICGGGGTPNACGDSNATDGGSCVNLCPYQVSCADGGTTTVTGTVVAGTNPANGFGQPDPLPGALVYVPNGTVQPFTTGVACDPCGASASGSPIASTTSAVDGTFTLTDVPCGTPNPVPLVVQIGRWRRQVTIGPLACCGTTALTADQTRMPRNHTEGDIPLIALATGNVDAHECILRKMGIDDSEFTAPANGGRVQLYVGNGATDPTGTAPSELSLTSSPATLAQYDQLMLPCWGGEDGQPASPDQPEAQISQNQQNLVDYANAGGRIYATHFSYVWLYNDPNDPNWQATPLTGPVPFSGTAQWDANANSWNSTCSPRGNPCPVDIDQSFPKGSLLAQWLQVVGVSATLGVIPSLDYPRWDFDNAIAPSENWLQWPGRTTPTESYIPLHYTFNTPVGVDAGIQCGRVVFSDFHVENSGGTAGNNFPSECGPAAPLTAQEKVLEFMLYDLASCIAQSGPIPPSCTPLTCAEQGFDCGLQGNGCGAQIDCGPCATGFCGGGGPGVCGGGCAPLSCAQLGLSCGPAGDGCGGVIDGGCGSCVPPQSCGGGGTPGVCGAPPCTKLTCGQLGYDCGPAPDGCGGQLDCGSCTPPQSCGGGGVPGVCGSGQTCVPLTCAEQGLSCGPAGNGCGGVIDGGCGICGFEGPSTQTCGGGGTPGVCGSAPCTPLTCAGLGYDCGAAADGCGGLLQCGSCDAGSCGGGGSANVCGSTAFH
ncbi:MAG: hypothetical protein ACYDCL_15265 [Myxococcales bacterium]